jgi:cytochrome c-type biogenesis protein CcmF
MLAPIAVVLLILTGIGPLIGWRKASPQNIQFHFLWPAVCGLVSTGGAALLRIHDWYVLATVFGTTFVTITIITEFTRGTLARIQHHSETWTVALLRTIGLNNRRYGGYIVHLGIVFIFLGIAGSAYKEVLEFSMKAGEWKSHGEYSIQLKGFNERKTENQEETYAIVDLYIGAQKVATLKPARFFYLQQQQPSTEVDIYSRWREDIYLTLGQMNPQTEEVVIHMTLNPLVSFLWFGGLILIIGALISMFPPLSRSNKGSLNP